MSQTPNAAGRGRGARKGRYNNSKRGTSQPLPAVDRASVLPKSNAPQQEESENICYLCTDPMKYYAVPECNHRTCHICTLRLRALYKQTNCTFCKEPQVNVVYTTSPDREYVSFDLQQIPFKDPKLSIYFETREIMEDSLILLQFNCPDEDCDYIGTGFGDLKLHTRATHNKLLCELCTRFKKIFAHEQALYNPASLPIHLPSASRNLSRSTAPPSDTGFEVHPMCLFCRECYFGDDELFKHMRERHEECFVCKRAGVQQLHFQDYRALEKHFQSTHYACDHPQCLSQKFVVFATEMDLKAHIVEQHGADMSTRDRRDARRVIADFTFEDVMGRRNSARDREKERERRVEQEKERENREREAKEREVRARILEARDISVPGPSRRREGFGAQLTASSGPQLTATYDASSPGSRTPNPNEQGTDLDPLTVERHTAFLSRVSQLTHNSSSSSAAIKSAIHSYRASESAAKDLVDTFYNVLERDLDATGSLLNSLVDLLDDEDKRDGVLNAWNGFKVERKREFPSLLPSPAGSDYSTIASGRAIRVKQNRPSNNTRGQVWARVEQAAASSFPSTSSLPLPTSSVTNRAQFPSLSTPSATGGGYRQAPRSTPWVSSSFQSSSNSSRPSPQGPSPPSSKPHDPGPKPKPPATSSRTLFPSLPSNNASGSSQNIKAMVGGNQSLRNIVAGKNETSNTLPSAWSTSRADGLNAKETDASTAGVDAEIGEAVDGGQGLGKAQRKKKKGKEKQMLFTLGSFPT